MDDLFIDLTPRRVMTLADAQALECNRCGQCCDSRRAYRASGDVRRVWQWGNAQRDGYAEFNGGKPLIIPLYQPHGDRAYEAMPQLADGTGHAYLREYTCARLEPQPDGSALCGLHDQPRPDICGSYPVFGAHADNLIERGAQSDVPIALDTPPGCTWANVWIEAAP